MISAFFLIPAFILGYIVCYFIMTYKVDQNQVLGYTVYMDINEKMLRQEIALEVESIPLAEGGAQLNALGMRMLAAKVIRGSEPPIK